MISDDFFGSNTDGTIGSFTDGLPFLNVRDSTYSNHSSIAHFSRGVSATQIHALGINHIRGTSDVASLYTESDSVYFGNRTRKTRLGFKTDESAVIEAGSMDIQCPLIVTTGGMGASGTTTTSYFFDPDLSNRGFNIGGWTEGSNGGSSTHNGIAIYTSEKIFSRVFISGDGYTVSSDSRIKSNIEDIEDSVSLDLINKLKPKTYNYKDITRGTDKVIGFLAQEVKEVLPTAVQLINNYLPNIFQMATINENTLHFETTLSLSVISDVSSGKIKSIDKYNREYFIDISSATSNTMTMTDASQINNIIADGENRIFVYGEEVSDFHTLKKETIIPITVGAIQELHKKQQLLEERILALENNNSVASQEVASEEVASEEVASEEVASEEVA
jgi:hypothetical protein